MERKILTVLAVFFLLQTAYLVFDGLQDSVGHVDAILVLGSKVKPDGTLSDRLKARLNRGYELYREGLSPKIIVSGGFGKEGHSEAKVMSDYLKGLGVPAQAILLDEDGNNTWQSAMNFRRTGFRSVILVSSYWHLTRAKLAFRKAGIQTIYTAHSRIRPEPRELYSIPREVVAFYDYLFLKKSSDRPPSP